MTGRFKPSYSATVLWVMLMADPRPDPFNGLTPMESRLGTHYFLGLVPHWPTCAESYAAVNR